MRSGMVKVEPREGGYVRLLVRADEVRPGDRLEWSEPGVKGQEFVVHRGRPNDLDSDRVGSWLLAGALSPSARSAISLHDRREMVEVEREAA